MSTKTTVIAAPSDTKQPATPAPAKAEDAESLRHRRAKVALGL